MWGNGQLPVVALVVPDPVSSGSKYEGDRRAWAERAKKDGFEVWTLRAVRITSAARDESSRPLWVLPAAEVVKLYRAAHRRAVAVVQFGSVRVSPNPLTFETTRTTLPLESVFRYKAFFVRGLGGTIDNAIASYTQWIDSVECDGDRDPRALPLHQFSPDVDWKDLHVQTGIEKFQSRHGGPSALIDSDQRPWKRPGLAAHGQEALVVAGVELPPGFHWDVHGSRNPSRLPAWTELWEFRKGTYLNVSPDGHVRAGSGGRSARRIFSEVKEGRSAPKHSRSQRRNARRK